MSDDSCYICVSILQAENNYRCIQEERRDTQQGLTGVQTRIKGVAKEIEKTQRGTDTYVELVTKETKIIKEEMDILEQLAAAEENEKRVFALLSSALRESHEKERARAERMKYWGIMGSIIGAVIGICGTTVNNHLRMKELKGIVSSATEMNQVYREKMMDVSMSVNEQYGKIYQFLVDIRSATGVTGGAKQKSSVGGKELVTVWDKDVKLEEVITVLKKQEELFDKELKKIGKVLATRKVETVEGTVVYVGPEIERMLKDTEKNLEWKMKIQALGTVTLISAIGALSIPVLLKLFGGS